MEANQPAVRSSYDILTEILNGYTSDIESSLVLMLDAERENRILESAKHAAIIRKISALRIIVGKLKFAHNPHAMLNPMIGKFQKQRMALADSFYHDLAIFPSIHVNVEIFHLDDMIRALKHIRSQLPA